MRDIGAYFKITDCFLCGKKEPEIDFHCYFAKETYRAPICLHCHAKHPSDQHVLMSILRKANQLHELEDAPKKTRKRKRKH